MEAGIPCLLIQQKRVSRLVVYFHANAEDIGQVRGFAKALSAQLSVSMLVVEYPGYGICSGEASEEGVLSDAEHVMRFVTTSLEVPLNRIIIMGRSMGGAPAIYLASKYRVAGLVTISTFSSIRAVVRSLTGWSFFFPNMFHNLQHIRSVCCTTLIIHGAEDELIDDSQAEELVQSCGADVGSRPRTMLRIYAGCGHNKIPMEKIVEPVLQEFPGILHGPALQRPLATTASEWLRKQARWVAPDVVERVPYDESCIPFGVKAAGKSS